MFHAILSLDKQIKSKFAVHGPLLVLLRLHSSPIAAINSVLFVLIICSLVSLTVKFWAPHNQGPCPRNLYFHSALDNAWPKIDTHEYKNEPCISVSIECVRLSQRNFRRYPSRKK